MARVTNAFSSYSAVGNREDLSDAIYNIDPFDTPLFSMAGRRNVTNRIFDWQTESLPSVNTSNADEEGYQLSRGAAQATVRLSNSTQISHRDATVTGSQEAINSAGRKSDMARQMAIMSKALKRDMESIAMSGQPRAAGDDSGNARKTRAVEHWIATNVKGGASYANPVSETAAITDGTLRNITEVLFNDTIQLAYDNGGEPTNVLVSSTMKRKISAFTGRSGSQIPTGKAEAVNTIDLYRSDFGDLKIMTTRWGRSRSILYIDPEYVKIAYFRPFHTWEPGKIGDADTKVIQAEWGVEMPNEKAHAKLVDLQ